MRGATPFVQVFLGFCHRSSQKPEKTRPAKREASPITATPDIRQRHERRWSGRKMSHNEILFDARACVSGRSGIKSEKETG